MCIIDRVYTVQNHGLEQRPSGRPRLLGKRADLRTLVRIESEGEQAPENFSLVAFYGSLQHTFPFEIGHRTLFQIVPATKGCSGERAECCPMIKQQLCGPFKLCLLYTSDAADERSSVDLGGRRI